MRKTSILVLIFSFAFVLAFNCVSLGQTTDKIEKSAEKTSVAETVETVKTVIKEIKKGMSVSEVEEAFGATSNVLKDKMGRTVMIYDRIPTKSVRLDSGSHDKRFVIQREITIVIRFDDGNLVDDFEYYPPRFVVHGDSPAPEESQN